MCEFLIGALVVGAMEVTPGWMTVDLLDRSTMGDPNRQPVVERVQIPTEHYLSCYE